MGCHPINVGHKGLRSRSALDDKIEVCDYCRPIRGIALYSGLVAEVARQAHNLKVTGSNPVSATI